MYCILSQMMCATNNAYDSFLTWGHSPLQVTPFTSHTSKELHFPTTVANINFGVNSLYHSTLCVSVNVCTHVVERNIAINNYFQLWTLVRCLYSIWWCVVSASEHCIVTVILWEFKMWNPPNSQASLSYDRNEGWWDWQDQWSVTTTLCSEVPDWESVKLRGLWKSNLWNTRHSEWWRYLRILITLWTIIMLLHHVQQEWP